MDARLREIEELLSIEESDSVCDTAFPVWPQIDRRKDQRYPFLADVIVVLPAGPDTVDQAEQFQSFQFISGHSINLSPDGIAFITSERIATEKFVLLMQHPDFEYPACCFSAQIYRSRLLEDSTWEHGALLRPLTQSPFPLAIEASRLSSSQS